MRLPRRTPQLVAALLLGTVGLAACGKHGTTPALSGDPVTTTTSSTIAPLTTTTAPQVATSTSEPAASPRVPVPDQSNTTTPVTSK